MEELDRGLEVALRGPEADGAVSRILRQVEEWGLALPKVGPLVLDFGLGDFSRVGEVEFWIANEVEAGYCGKFLFVFPGQTCPTHYHKDKLETFYIVRGRMKMVHLGKERVLCTGDVLRVATGEKHCFTGIESTLLLEVSKPSMIDDNFFEDTRIPIGGNYRGGRGE